MELFIRYLFIALGLLIFGAIFWLYFRRSRKQATPSNQHSIESFDSVFFDDQNQQDQPIEDEIFPEEIVADEPEEGIEENFEPTKEIEDIQEVVDISTDEKEKEPLEKHPEEWVQIAVLAKAERSFGGYDLLQTLTANHFHFGDMNIFHYHRDMNPTAPQLFSLASVQKPGDFDLDKIGIFKTKGLVLFMNRADHPEHADHVQELMQSVACQLAEELDGIVKTDLSPNTQHS